MRSRNRGKTSSCSHLAGEAERCDASNQNQRMRTNRATLDGSKPGRTTAIVRFENGPSHYSFTKRSAQSDKRRSRCILAECVRDASPDMRRPRKTARSHGPEAESKKRINQQDGSSTLS